MTLREWYKENRVMPFQSKLTPLVFLAAPNPEEMDQFVASLSNLSDYVFQGIENDTLVCLRPRKESNDG